MYIYMLKKDEKKNTFIYILYMYQQIGKTSVYIYHTYFSCQSHGTKLVKRKLYEKLHRVTPPFHSNHQNLPKLINEILQIRL